MKLTDFFSLQWWVSVGIAAVLWSIINDAVKRGIFKLLGAFFRSWGDRNEAAFQKFNSDAAKAVMNTDAYALCVRQENTLRQKAIYRLLWSMLFVATAGIAQLLPAPQNALDYWPFTILRSHTGFLVTFIVSVSYAMFAARSWKAARRCEMVIRRADSIRPFTRNRVDAPGKDTPSASHEQA